MDGICRTHGKTRNAFFFFENLNGGDQSVAVKLN